VAQGQLQAQMETERILFQAVPQFLCSEGSEKVHLSRSDCLTCGFHKLVCTLARPALSWWYLGMECCGIGLATSAVAPT
jgi:ferredoxin-like protein FixX